MWLVVDMRHTHTHTQNMGIGAFLQHRVWCDHRTIVCKREMYLGLMDYEQHMM